MPERIFMHDTFKLKPLQSERISPEKSDPIMNLRETATRIVLSFVTGDSARRRLLSWKRKTEWTWDRLTNSSGSFLAFRCNACGERSSFLRTKLLREPQTCLNCGSGVRQRSIIHALSTELFGASLALPDFPIRKDLVGIGLSDWDGFALGLAEKLSYTNTYYHQEPLLDITKIDPSQSGRYDFIISSEVFEHIAPPVSKAFENARLLLKPGGVMIFTVPYVEGKTKEHFPELHEFSLQRKENRTVLVNRTIDGRTQEYSELTFHGGAGSVIEMRLFGKDDLLRCIQDAGFELVRVYSQENLEHGILWLPYIAEEARYRPLIYGLDSSPWALRTCAQKSRTWTVQTG